jgi:sulfoxide reductase heme-binding subunit YedZ
VSPDRQRWIGRAAWLLVALPALGLAVAAATDRLGPDPVETLTHTTGDWGLRFLVLTLCVTPARRWLRLRWVAPLRRTFGLGAFGYACLHLGTYLVFEHFFDWSAIWEDVAERTWVTAGFTAFVLMVPLAATSTRASMRRMGRRWLSLHRLVYAAAVAAVVHFLWLVKADLREPLIYATVVGALLGARLWQRHGRRSG